MLDTLEVNNLEAAQAGDQEAFGDLTEPYRRELLVHCYRMLGSLEEAEDLVQETLLRAWRRLDTFERRAAFRAWLYKIATNACLNALERERALRRTLPGAVYPAAEIGARMAPPVVQPIWLEPFPDEWLPDTADSPEGRYTALESITLAFLLALQLLPPRQRAVLILRDVLDWHARETAELLGLTVSAVNSALHRARATMSKHYRAGERAAAEPKPEDETTRRLLDQYVRAWDAADITQLIRLLKDDAAFTMPPTPTWFRGPAAIAAFITAEIFAGEGPARGARLRLIQTRANGQPAMAVYHRANADQAYRAFTLQVLTVDASAGKIAQITNFLNPELFAHFDLPPELT
jgi:RNA polymerase sigma-70 factor (ECF subfamily)